MDQCNFIFFSTRASNPSIDRLICPTLAHTILGDGRMAESSLDPAMLVLTPQKLIESQEKPATPTLSVHSHST